MVTQRTTTRIEFTGHEHVRLALDSTAWTDEDAALLEVGPVTARIPFQLARRIRAEFVGRLDEVESRATGGGQ